MHHATAAAKSPNKFHILHERHVWKSPSVNKRTPPAKHSMIAASHSEQEPRVMRKAVRQSVHGRRDRQADPKVTASDFWIAHYAANLIQRFRRHFGVCMKEPENIAAGRAGTGVHLYRTAVFAAPNKLIAKPCCKVIRAIGACAIDDDDFRAKGSPAQIREKRAYQCRLIKDRNDNRDLH